MAVFTGIFLVDFLIGLCTLLLILYAYLSSTNNYWKNRGIPFIKPSLMFGNLKEVVLRKKNLMDLQRDLYNELKGEKFKGYFEFAAPCLLVRDPEMIERILIKDFAHFTDRGLGDPDLENEPLTANLLGLNGSMWRFMRHKLTPTFTSGKLKGMFEQICNCGEELISELDKYSASREDVEAKTVIAEFTTDVIASCAFGLQLKSDSEEGKEFKMMVNKVTNPTRTQMIRFFLFASFQRIARFMKMRRFDPTAGNYFMDIVKTTMDYRRKNNIKRNDFLQLLMAIKDQDKAGKTVDLNQELKEEDAYLKQANYKPSENDKNNLELTDDLLAAQAFLFLVAGSETTSSTTSYAMYALATNPEVQQKAQLEVDAMLAKNGSWSYQAVKDMTYLDQVVQEGLRKYPMLPVLNRVVTSPYRLPGTDITLQTGQRITIPVYATHMDPEHYPDPETFDPERFKDNNHKTSFKYMPFGDGPRMCIAMRFALLEMKICLARILSRYTMSVSDKTQMPLQYDTSNSFSNRPKGGIWLQFKQRQL